MQAVVILVAWHDKCANTRLLVRLEHRRLGEVGAKPLGVQSSVTDSYLSHVHAWIPATGDINHITPFCSESEF